MIQDPFTLSSRETEERCRSVEMCIIFKTDSRNIEGEILDKESMELSRSVSVLHSCK